MNVRLVVAAGPHAGTEFAFDRHDTFLVGRSKDAHLRLPGDDPYVSRRFLDRGEPTTGMTSLVRRLRRRSAELGRPEEPDWWTVAADLVGPASRRPRAGGRRDAGPTVTSRYELAATAH